MAGGMQIESGSGRGRKPLDTSINLVPFIDLMAVTISFLIMTAVWNQTGRLEVAGSGGPTSGELPIETGQRITVTVTTGGLTLASGASRLELPNHGGSYDLDGLVARLVQIHDAFPGLRAVTIAAEDAVRYEDLVRLIDRCIGAGLPEISVTPAT